MTTRDPNGIPILGATDPEAELRKHIEGLSAEKNALQQDDHDWMVAIYYHMSEYDSSRAHIALRTGIKAVPPIMLHPALQRGESGPVCARCQQTYDAAGTPCPGMSFKDYLGTLSPDEQVEMLDRMKREEAEQFQADVEHDIERVPEISD